MDVAQLTITNDLFFVSLFVIAIVLDLFVSLNSLLEILEL